MNKFAFALLMLIAAKSAIATPPAFIADKHRGYFFHEIEPENKPPEKKKKEEKKISVVGQAAEPKPFTQDWFEKNLPKLRDKAIDDPTRENMIAYLIAQKLWTNSASNFSSMFSTVALENPWLTEEKFRPTAGFGAAFYDKRAKQTKDNIVKRLSKAVGIWFFYSSDCDYCHAQSPVLRDLQDRLGLKILAVSMDGGALPEFPRFVRDRGQADKYNITVYPTLMIFQNGKLFPLAEGILSSDQITDRLVYFAKENGWISEKEWNKTQPVDSDGVLTPEFMRALTPEDVANPRRLADKVKKQLSQQSE